MPKREPNPEVQAWCLEKLAEIERLQQEMHRFFTEREKRRTADAAQNVRQAIVEAKPAKNKAPRKSGQSLLPSVPVQHAKSTPRVDLKRAAAATPAPVRTRMPPIHQTRAQFWQQKNSGALEAYKRLPDEEKQARARALQAEYDAEVSRLGLNRSC